MLIHACNRCFRETQNYEKQWIHHRSDSNSFKTCIEWVTVLEQVLWWVHLGAFPHLDRLSSRPVRYNLQQHRTQQRNSLHSPMQLSSSQCSIRLPLLRAQHQHNLRSPMQVFSSQCLTRLPLFRVDQEPCLGWQETRLHSSCLQSSCMLHSCNNWETWDSQMIRQIFRHYKLQVVM